MAEPLLEVVDLNVSFHTDDGAVQAVRGVDLSVAAGEVLAVVGERDPFGTPAELRTAVQAGWEGRNRIVVIPGAGHPLIPAAKVLPRDAVRAMIADAVATFVLDRAAARE